MLSELSTPERLQELSQGCGHTLPVMAGVGFVLVMMRQASSKIPLSTGSGDRHEYSPLPDSGIGRKAVKGRCLLTTISRV